MSTPAWVADWLSAGRFQKYLNAAGGDTRLAFDLYEWNSALASAFLRDLGYLEIGLRNAYDRALLRHPDATADWLDDAALLALFPVHMVTDKSGSSRDKNATPRSNVKTARKHSGYNDGIVPRGKAVAELMFGFWSYLTDDLHEKTLRVPSLHKAYVAGADREKIHSATTALREFRNRVAHHESVFDRAPENHRRYIVSLARQISPDLAAHIHEGSRLPALIADDPRRARARLGSATS